MKALLYKEFKLAVHPICYVFVLAFPLMILIPHYPILVGFVYVISCYPILFLGANKGQQSNDLLYSTLLPVRKKDIVLARIFTVLIIQLVFILLMSALYPLGVYLNELVKTDPVPGTATKEFTQLGMPTGFVSALGFAIVAYAIADIIFFSIYYKNGKSIVLSSLLTIIGFGLFLATFTIIIPNIPSLGEGFMGFFADALWIQFIVLGVGILLSALLHIITYKISAKELEQVDF